MSRDIDLLIDFIESGQCSESSVSKQHKVPRSRCSGSSPFSLSAFSHFEVLHFWFGTDDGGHWSQNQRTKWFVSSRDPLQRTLDAEITRKFGALLDALRSDDALRSEWRRHSAASCLAAIIVLDQFCRHIFRSELDGHGRGSRAVIDECDAMALSLSQSLLSLDRNVLSTSLTVPQYVFGL